MSGLPGIECTQRLKTALPGVGIVVVTAYLERPLILESLMAGASGYLLKPGNPEEYQQAIRVVAGGGVVLSEPVLTELIHSLQDSKTQAHPCLSPRERGIMTHLIQGKSDKDIARAIGTELSTVQSHMRHIQAKLGVHSRRASIAKFLGVESGMPAFISAYRKGL